MTDHSFKPRGARADLLPVTVAAAPLAPARARTRALALDARVWLALVVVASAVSRLALVLRRTTPTYVPDEFLYSDLARSLGTAGRPLLRGGHVAFPALLEPLLAAPLWRVHDVGLAFQLTQGLNVALISLSPVPVFLLCRRLGLRPLVALAGAVFTAVQPAFVYGGWITADALGYTLALAAVYAMVVALDRPTARSQATALAFAALATLARVQYAVLVPAFVLAALVLDGRRGRELARRYAVTLSALGLAAAGALALGPGHVLGVYSGAAALPHAPGVLVAAAETQLNGLLYGLAPALLPGALVGLALALFRPRARAERAFALVLAPAALALFAEATVVAAGVGTGTYMERYLVALLPLALPAFALAWGRGRPAAMATVAAAAAVIALSARLPVTSLIGGDLATESQLLRGIVWLETQTSSAGAAAVVAGVTAALAAIAAAAALAPRLRALPIVAAIAAGILTSGAAHALDIRVARDTAQRLLAPDRAWIDDAGVGRAGFLVTPRTSPALALEQLFWNRSLRDVWVLPGAHRLDQGVTSPLSIGPDGTLLVAGRPLAEPIAVPDVVTTLRLAGATRVASRVGISLWRPDGTVRASLLADRTSSGWLANVGSIRVWSPTGRVHGTLVLALRGPGRGRRTTLSLSAPGYRRILALAGVERVSLDVPARSTGPWRLDFGATQAIFTDGDLVSVRAARIVFLPSRGGRTAARPPQP